MRFENEDDKNIKITLKKTAYVDTFKSWFVKSPLTSKDMMAQTSNFRSLPARIVPAW